MEPSTVTFDRRQIYRPFLARLTPSLSETLTDLIVAPENDPREPNQPPIHVAFANAAELTQGVQMALVGGIGSGKTTELWLTRKVLNRHRDAINIFIDLAESTDLNELNPGGILIAIGIQLYERLREYERTDTVRLAIRQLHKLAGGTTEWVPHRTWDPEEEPNEATSLRPIDIPGLLPPRFPAIQRNVSEVLSLVSDIAAPLLGSDAQITVMIDGLDRLIRPERFRRFAEQDLRALRGTRISIIVAAPLLLWFEKDPFFRDSFDEVKHLPAAISIPGKSNFLKQVLFRRGAAELMGEDEISQIARASGGVLRDLITLARTSAEAAYREDKDRIGDTHVRSAIRQLGRRYLVGLGKYQRGLIRRLVDDEEFSIDSPTSRELLVNRQVLEYVMDGRDRFAVHPALIEVLPELDD